MTKQRLRADVLDDFQWTYAEHDGFVSVAADRLGMSMSALSRALYRANSAGAGVIFHDDTYRELTRRRA